MLDTKTDNLGVEIEVNLYAIFGVNGKVLSNKSMGYACMIYPDEEKAEAMYKHLKELKIDCSIRNVKLNYDLEEGESFDPGDDYKISI